MPVPAPGPAWSPARSIFDAHEPPPADVVDDCVHCGFCLASCPTYLLEGNETNSPRGRIDLIKLGQDGRIDLDVEFVANFDACLGCLACVTACPSGVRYDQLLEATRPQIERHWTRTPADRAFRALIFALFPHPARLRPLAVLGLAYQRLGARRLLRATGLLSRLPARLQALEALLPTTRLRAVVRRQPAFLPAQGARRRRVGLLTGCVQRVYFSDVNAAVTRVLTAEGCDVVAPPAQECCGALSGHAGRAEEAKGRARRVIDTFEAADVDDVVIAVAGCGSAMKDYGSLLADDAAYAARAAVFSARVKDFSEVLVELGPAAPRHPIEASVAYHDACHLRHAQQITAQPRAVLAAIPGLRVLEIGEADVCCGSAGIYNLVEPEAAARLGARKAEHLLATRPDAVATANAGCLLQLRRYVDDGVPLFHPAELVDASIRGVRPPGLSGGVADRPRPTPVDQILRLMKELARLRADDA